MSARTRAGKPRCRPGTPLRDRIAHHVDVDEGGCWLWTAAIIYSGYGLVYVDGGMRLAHRASYEEHIGPIPEGLTLDHTCRVRNCVNPDHLEPVTHLENVRRAPRALATACSRGHVYDEANTHITPRGSRRCRACERELKRESRAAAKERAA